MVEDHREERETPQKKKRGRKERAGKREKNVGPGGTNEAAGDQSRQEGKSKGEEAEGGTLDRKYREQRSLGRANSRERES